MQFPLSPLLDPSDALHLRREKAAIIMLPEAWQNASRVSLDLSSTPHFVITVTDMRKIEVDLNDLGLIEIELRPRKICSELELNIAIEDSMIARGFTDDARSSRHYRFVVRHKSLPREV